MERSSEQHFCYQQIKAELRSLDCFVGQCLLDGNCALLGQHLDVHQDGCHEVELQALEHSRIVRDLCRDHKQPIPASAASIGVDLRIAGMSGSFFCVCATAKHANNAKPASCALCAWSGRKLALP